MLQLLKMQLHFAHVFDELRPLRVGFADLAITAFQQFLLCIQPLLRIHQASLHTVDRNLTVKIKKGKGSHTRYRALGPQLIPM